MEAISGDAAAADAGWTLSGRLDDRREPVVDGRARARTSNSPLEPGRLLAELLDAPLVDGALVGQRDGARPVGRLFGRRSSGDDGAFQRSEALVYLGGAFSVR